MWQVVNKTELFQDLLCEVRQVRVSVVTPGPGHENHGVHLPHRLLPVWSVWPTATGQ